MESLKNKSSIKIIVKPNSAKSELVRYDENRQAYRVNIAAPPDKGKVNREVIVFFSKMLKKKVEIVKGLRSKEKVLRLL